MDYSTSDTPLATHPANPGNGSTFGVEYAAENGATHSEEIDLLSLLAGVLTGNGYNPELRQGWLWLAEGLRVLPQLLRVEGGETFRSSTTIEVAAVNGLFEHLFEFQHSIGDDSLQECLSSGFDLWARADLPVYLDALRAEPECCHALSMTFPDGSGVEASRRILLGPVTHFAEAPEAQDGEEHPFCPCCLFTNSADAFMERVKEPEIRIVRLYAARNTEGQAMADCRVNGQDDAAGHAELLKYVSTWPERGFEFRKQLILIQPAPEA